MSSNCRGKFSTYTEENQANQKIAEEVISALQKYVTRFGEWPKNLEALVPDYIPSLPKTTRNADFSYRPSSIDGYYLCFGDGKKTNFKQYGCCYNPKFGWDCSPGD